MAEFMKPAPPPSTALGLHRPLSSTAGIRVSPLALGAMSIGSAWSAFMGPMTKPQAFSLLDAFTAAGGNFIDTANCYQDDESEEWIGEWMEARQNRDQVVLATKYSFSYKAVKKEDKSPANNNFWGNHRRSLHVSLRDSLAKLRTEWVDLLYVHFWDYSTSVEEVMDSLHMLVQSGKVLYLGISDTPAWVVAAANTYARDNGKTPFSVYQGQWSVLCRDLEREVLPMAVHFGMSVLAWNVLGGGKLRAEGKSNENPGRSGMEQSEVEKKMSKALAEVGRAHGTDSVAAVALAYVRAKAPNVIPLVGGRKIEHLKDNIDSLSLTLTEEDVQSLESVSEFDYGFPTTFIGQDWRLTGKPALALISQGPIADVKKA